MQFYDAQNCVDLFFQMLGTSKKCRPENGVSTYDVILDLPIHGISCPVGARKLILRFPDNYNPTNVDNDVIIYAMGDTIIKKEQFKDEAGINSFLSANFRRVDVGDVREELIRINEKMDEFLKQDLKSDN